MPTDPIFEERINFLKTTLKVTISGLSQASGRPHELLELLQPALESHITETTAEAVQETLKRDLNSVIEQVKYDLAKPSKNRSVNINRKQKDNVVSVDFGNKDS